MIQALRYVYVDYYRAFCLNYIINALFDLITKQITFFINGPTDVLSSSFWYFDR